MLSIRISAFFLFLALVESKIVHEDKKNSNGRFRITYDDDVSDNCESLVMIGVGTNMGNGDYDILTSKVSTGKPIVTVFTDHQSGPVKLDEKKYANLYNSITEDLDAQIPVCEGKSPKIIIGGHSASGRASLQAMDKELLSSAPDGYIGLDPFQAQKEPTRSFKGTVPGTKIDPALPMLSWGFEKSTCSVNVDIAAKSAYELAGKDNRVFYRVANTGRSNRSIGHCEFADNGCKVGGLFSLPGCPSRRNGDVKDVMAESIQVFVAAVSKGDIQTSDFELDTSNAGVGIEVFVNSADVLVPNMAEL